jgi:hypothetical protein
MNGRAKADSKQNQFQSFLTIITVYTSPTRLTLVFYGVMLLWIICGWWNDRQLGEES